MSVHPDCPLGTVEHERHYLGRDERHVPQRCEGFVEDLALSGDYWQETGWTGR